MTFLSVIMPTFNGESFVSSALESVRTQDRQGIELIVVDDGSTDRTVEIVREFGKSFPIRLVTPGRIGNWVAVTNIGLQEATGEWACFLHQDDLWLPRRMARLQPELERAPGAILLHNAMFVGPDGNRLGPWTCPLPEGLVQPDEFMEHLLIQNFIAIPSPVFRRRTAIDSGGLDETLWFTADWDLWLRLGAMGPVRFIAETLTGFRVHPASQTAARQVRENEWTEQSATVVERHLPRWKGSKKRYKLIERVAMTSIAVNSALSAASRGESIAPTAVLLELLGLGPLGWHRYLRDSRIVQRVWPRLKVHRRKKQEINRH
jgi:hypothetical protein